MRVPDRTRISLAFPGGEMVASSTDDVTLACLATTDARRAQHLRVTWYRDRLPVSSDRLPVSSKERGRLSFSSDRLPVSSETGRVRLMGDGSRLVIVDARVDDSGVYRCAASNGVDHDSASVRVTIKGLSML